MVFIYEENHRCSRFVPERRSARNAFEKESWSSLRFSRDLLPDAEAREDLFEHVHRGGLPRDGCNLFDGFSEKAASFLAGVMRRIGEITVFTNPLPGSYDRLGKSEAPFLISWSGQNRSSLVRLPVASGRDCRMEVRSPDCACNPYYVLKLLISAGMEGIEDGLELPPPYNQNSYDEEARKELKALPPTLGEAVAKARESAFVHEALPKTVVDTFLDTKARQAEAWDAAKDRDAFELKHYFMYI